MTSRNAWKRAGAASLRTFGSRTCLSQSTSRVVISRSGSCYSSVVALRSTVSLLSRDFASEGAPKKKVVRTTTSELVNYLKEEQKHEQQIIEEAQRQENERKKHLEMWLQKYNFKLSPIEPTSSEVSLTKEEGSRKITIKLDMNSRRLSPTEEEDQGDDEEQQEEEQEERAEGKEEEEEGEKSEEDNYFEEKDFEVWVENKEGQVMTIHGDISADGLGMWQVGIYKNAQAANDGKASAEFDIRKLDEEGYEKWRLFLNGYGIDDEFVLISDYLCELYDEQAYANWLQATKEFLLK